MVDDKGMVLKFASKFEDKRGANVRVIRAGIAVCGVVIVLVQAVLLGMGFMVVVGNVLEWLCGGFVVVPDILRLG